MCKPLQDCRLRNRKQPLGVFCGRPGHFGGVYAPQGGDFFGDVVDIGRFIALAAVGLGRQVRAVRFDEHAV